MDAAAPFCMSALEGVSGLRRPKTADFDDTMCRVVSSPEGLSRLRGPKTTDIDDTMRRVVSSLEGVMMRPTGSDDT